MDIIVSQLSKLPYPEADCTGKTFIVVGANIGLGKEAVRHFVRLNASRVVLAVRSIQRGEAAKADIEATTKRKGVMDVWEIDLGSYASVKAFAARVGDLPRVDAVVANASIATHTFEMLEDNESTITVNVVSTILLVLLLLPTLRVTASKCGIIPIITIVSSDIHSWTNLPERLSLNILATLNNKQTAVMADRCVPPLSLLRPLVEPQLMFPHRYPASKLLQVFAFREIYPKLANKEPKVVLNMLNPGLCKTSLTRNATGVTKVQMAVFKGLLGRSAEMGSRTLVHAATAGPESHGCYMSDCDINKYALSDEGQGFQGDTNQALEIPFHHL